MWRKILVAVDGSPASEAVVEAARELCRGREGCRVTLLRVLPPPEPKVSVAEAWSPAFRDWDVDVLMMAERHARAQLEPLRARLEEAGIPAEVEIAIGRPGEEIVFLAQVRGYDVIVIGRRGLGLVAGLLLGSVSDYVVRHSPVPVLVVEPAPRAARPRLLRTGS